MVIGSCLTNELQAVRLQLSRVTRFDKDRLNGHRFLKRSHKPYWRERMEFHAGRANSPNKKYFAKNLETKPGPRSQLVGINRAKFHSNKLSSVVLEALL